MSLKRNDFKRYDEEFTNFMHQVTEVESIVRKLASNDKKVQEIGDMEAKRYLGEDSVYATIDDENVKLKIKENRTVFNEKALHETVPLDSDTMSQEAFKREVERDAEKRYQDKLVRKEKMETLRKQAVLAFKRGEFERALSCYSKAIDHIKDNSNLYLSRALTYLNLKFYEKALPDIDWALRISKDSLKGWLLKAKTHLLLGNNTEFEIAINEAKERNPNDEKFIDEYVAEIVGNSP